MPAEKLAIQALRGPIVRLLLAREKFRRAKKQRDEPGGWNALEDMVREIDNLEGAWSSVEAAELDGHVSSAVDAAMDQLRRRATHN